MTRRERLMATLQGEPVDRPAVNFYEIGGFAVDPKDPNPFNIYSSPDWQPLLQLAEEQTDLIRMRGARFTPAPDNCSDEFFKQDTWMENGSQLSRTTLTVGGRTMTSLSRRDPEVETTWSIEHLLKSTEDAEAYLELPDEAFAMVPDVSHLFDEEKELGDRGIIMMGAADPLCYCAPLFSMEDYTVIALTEPDLFHRLLEQAARRVYGNTETIAREFPGHLWRIVGPEYATEPYLPPRLFDEYVVRYIKPIIESIQRYGGYARIHCHGRIKNALPMIAALGADGLDPIEPPHQGDVLLGDVRREYGRQMVLFGNLEVSDIETMPPAEFEKVVAQSLRDGTEGEGRGFVLMPSASPYGRRITPATMANYETMVRLATGFEG